METPETSPDPVESDALPLAELTFTPEWVKARPVSYTGHSGGDRGERGFDRGRRDDGRGPRKEGGASRGFGDRRKGGAPPQRSDRRAGAGPPQRSDRPPRQEDRRGPPRPDRAPQSSPPRAPREAPPAPVEVSFLPEEKGFAAMVDAMKQSTRAYALFDLARLILNKPERHVVRLTRRHAPNEKPAPLFLVPASENPFLTQQDAQRFLFRHHADLFFKEIKTPIDPPKGIFTYVNRCGFTGEMLGPPNHHSYMERLRQLHRTRLSHVPFDEVRLKVRTEKDPEAIKAWLDSMSGKIEFTCPLDAEPKPFASRAEIERYVIENHLAKYITASPEVRITGTASRQIAQDDILDAVRDAWLAERKFPLKTANGIRPLLYQRGFHLFKRRKGITFVTWIKFKRFESALGLTDRIQKLIVFLRDHEGVNRKQLLDALVPPPAPLAEAAANLPADAAPETPTPPPAPLPLTAEQQAERNLLLTDLAWLIRDGYVVEFSDGALWALGDEPPKPAPAPKSQPKAEPAQTVELSPAPVQTTGISPDVPVPLPAEEPVISTEPPTAPPAEI